jgi:hypothetical protein
LTICFKPRILAVSQSIRATNGGGFVTVERAMPYKKEEDDDLFEDDFEFVDDEDDEEEDEEDEYEDDEDSQEEDSEVDEVKKSPAKPKRGSRTEKSPRETAPKGRSKPAPKPRSKAPVEKPVPAPPADVDEQEDVAEEAVEPEVAQEPAGPPLDHVVHVYEFRKYKRTIQRDFSSEEADKFAVEYNRTSANHSRWAVSGGKDDQPTPKI